MKYHKGITDYQKNTWVIVKVKPTYAATDREVIHANGAPNLYASIPATMDIWRIYVKAV